MKVLDNNSELLEGDNNASKCLELISLTQTFRLAEWCDTWVTWVYE
jgi:hypothetical protein